jgi:hypothetical protein
VEEPAQDDEGSQRPDLEHHQDALDQAAAPNAETVDRRQPDDGDDGQRGLADRERR